jgi:hypothetical protein
MKCLKKHGGVMAKLTLKLSEEMLKETIKHWYDLFKHITTLGTASIVVLATFFTKGIVTTNHTFLLVMCLLGIIASLITCVIGMYLVTAIMSILSNPKSTPKKINLYYSITGAMFGISISNFMVGVGFLASFVLANIKWTL